jgi:hypothetical protein
VFAFFGFARAAFVGRTLACRKQNIKNKTFIGKKVIGVLQPFAKRMAHREHNPLLDWTKG